MFILRWDCIIVHCLYAYQAGFHPSRTAVAQWLRCCVTNRKVAGSIPAGVSGFFIDIKSSDRTMALGSTQPLTEMSTRSISWGQRRPVHKADNLPPSCAIVMKSGNLNFLEPSGPLRACNSVFPCHFSSTPYCSH